MHKGRGHATRGARPVMWRRQPARVPDQIAERIVRPD